MIRNASRPLLDLPRFSILPGKTLRDHLREPAVFCSCKKLLVLGGDLGESYLEGWKNAGGPKEDAKRFESLEELQKDFQQDWDQKSIVLVKGSRSAAMERFVKAIQNHESK